MATKKKTPAPAPPAPDEPMHPNGYPQSFMDTIPEGTYIFPKNHTTQGDSKEEREQALADELRG